MVLFSLWWVASNALGQPGPELETHVSTDSVLIGERFHVSVVARHDGSAQVLFPPADAGSLIFKDLDVLERSPKHSSARGRGTHVDSVTYKAVTFSLDSVRVPGLPVQVVIGGDTTIVTAPARTVTVVSVVGSDAKGIHGVAPPAPFPRPIWTWIVLGMVLVSLVGALIYYVWWHKAPRRSRSPRRRVEADQTPYEAATSWMRQLESYDLSDPDAVKPFYVELSTAIRVYIARELDIAALERTTREVVEVLSHRPDVPEEAAARIRAVLELADLVKFADIRPTSDDHAKALREARAALDAIEAAPRALEPEVIDGVASPA